MIRNALMTKDDMVGAKVLKRQQNSQKKALNDDVRSALKLNPESITSHTTTSISIPPAVGTTVPAISPLEPHERDTSVSSPRLMVRTMNSSIAWLISRPVQCMLINDVELMMVSCVVYDILMCCVITCNFSFDYLYIGVLYGSWYGISARFGFR